MPQAQPMQPSNQLTPDTAKAAMGNATFLMSHLLPQGQAQQTAQNANPAPETPSNQTTPGDTNSQMQGLESRIMDELGTLKDEIKQVGDSKVSTKELKDLRDQIDTILSSND